ncbi:MAG TPA: hypothetical protein VM687_03300 [Stenotrophomonas sp.]|nr:hypothetical protein [Stenotrophomonas sp.]
MASFLFVGRRRHRVFGHRLQGPLAVCLAALLFCSSGSVLADALSSAAELKALSVATREEASKIRERRLADFYAAHLSPLMNPDALPGLDADPLAALFDSAHLMVFYTGSSRYLADLQRIASALERKRPLSVSEGKHYFGALIQTRRFEAAAAFAASAPLAERERVPLLRPAPSGVLASAYRVSAQADVLEEVAPALSGTRLVIVGHPLCAFSQRAEAALQTMPGLPTGLRTRTLRLAPVGQALYLAQLREWNANHGGLEILLTRHERDWPMINDWATPNFYLLQDGRVVDHFSGWPREGREARFREMVARFEHCLATACPGTPVEGS